MKVKVTCPRCLGPWREDLRRRRRGRGTRRSENGRTKKKGGALLASIDKRPFFGFRSTRDAPPLVGVALHALPLQSLSSSLQAADWIGLPLSERLVAVFVSAFALVSAAVWGGTRWELRNCEPLCGYNNLPRGTATREKAGRMYTLGVVPIFLATPFFARATFRQEVVPGQVWTFEQKQGIGLGLNTSVNVKMTVVKLMKEKENKQEEAEEEQEEGGGEEEDRLFIYNLIAPTRECVQLLKELGRVEVILLPTTTFEHKQFLSDFSKTFPDAKIVVAPGQYTWPVNLKRKQGRAEVLYQDENNEQGRGQGLLPREIETVTLDLPPVGLSPTVRFTEVAVFHERSKCLLCCDAVMHLSREVPLPISKRDLLEWANDNNTAITGLRILGLFGVRERWKELKAQKKRKKKKKKKEEEEEEEEACDLGWQRMAMTSLYFGQSNVLQPQESFTQLAERKLFVPPVVATLVYGWDGNIDKDIATEVSRWSEKVSQWSFTTVIPAHFDTVKASPKDWSLAFEQWSPSQQQQQQQQKEQQEKKKKKKEKEMVTTSSWDYDMQDIQCLRDVRTFLRKVGVIFDPDSRPKRPKKKQ